MLEVIIALPIDIAVCIYNAYIYLATAVCIISTIYTDSVYMFIAVSIHSCKGKWHL